MRTILLIQAVAMLVMASFAQQNPHTWPQSASRFTALNSLAVGAIMGKMHLNDPVTMRNDMTEAKSSAAKGEWFASTHWSVVLAARESDTAPASEALEKLCRTYWPPLYAFIRRQGYAEAEAKDLTQEFFFRLIDREFLQHLRHQRGRFRSFLLTFLKHFLMEQRGKANAQKRGGGTTTLSLDQLNDEGSYLAEPVDHMSPDQVFDRRWAQTVFQVALNRLEGEYQSSGKGELFQRLKDARPRESGAPTYAEIGTTLGLTEAAVKSAVQRMRQRHREILREEIAHTVTRPEDLDAEIRYLREVLSGAP